MLFLLVIDYFRPRCFGCRAQAPPVWTGRMSSRWILRKYLRDGLRKKLAASDTVPVSDTSVPVSDSTVPVRKHSMQTRSIKKKKDFYK